MNIFLQIAGIVFLILLLAVLLIFLVLRSKWRKFRKSLEGVQQETPSVIHLNEDLSPDWLDEETPRSMIDRLTRAGFNRGRAYTIPEMPNVRLTGLFHVKWHLCCVVYDHDSVGNWVDFALHYEDGEELTISNAPGGGEIDCRPEVTKIFRPGASIDDLFAELKENILKKPRIPISDETFRGVFEESYEKDMKWRNERGGVTEAEVRRVAEKMGMEVDEEVMEAAMEEIRGREIDRLHEECLDRFVEETDMRVAQWSKYQETGEFMVVSDVFSPEPFGEYLLGYFELPESQEGKVLDFARKAASSRVLFEKVNGALSPGLRAKKIGEVDSPIAAEIFWVPDADA